MEISDTKLPHRRLTSSRERDQTKEKCILHQQPLPTTTHTHAHAHAHAHAHTTSELWV
jgi:hypothetical protein